ncbi:MAG TPA: Sec-independent protein translocase subunit TatA [Streptosporangiaceae bacterium]|nr:Sec-independent protein translocase subunit TatA [Streptosporangiaceae bacterium]
MDLFDSPWKILIVAIVIIVLFGSAKLPVAARSLGRSMRILKSEVSSMHDDEDEAKSGQSPAQLTAAAAAPAPAAPVAQPAPLAQSTTQDAAEQLAHQARIDGLEQQIQELKDSTDKKAAVSADQQPR